MPLLSSTFARRTIGFLVAGLLVLVAIVGTSIWLSQRTAAHAEAAGMRGDIRVVLQRLGEDMLSLAVEDDGVGWKGIGAAQGTGLGTRIITAMAANLQSQVEYDAGVTGTRASLKFRV